ncbi:D-glycero-alpha-D-manno-heptose 1-phosphate guanylyltransferase [Chitinophaga sp. YR573]|uniref:nucleotidyltransferase family protein n=1 Tax=Chitinophaga sp. YR573 TaxID=1881040 RepID=UPI0008B8D7FC|nr:nucleotidyltransferase family protein [Chitinophaga sp. YR573]SEW38791.1 D-glycero-alpha-D-manno-heptose 1-phosphate guanylyltransferase [Chitinophaga sp. YR573]
MITECIVLAGGLGTRLRSVVADKPKCMAPVGKHPFLYYLLKYLQEQGITHVILSLGYKSEQVIDWCQEANLDIEISFVIEEEPLGTGGGILLAMSKVKGNEFFITNGDTFFGVPLNEFYNFHQQKQSALSLALKPMYQFERYGSVELDENDRITAFLEKQFREEGLINGGIYLTSKQYLQSLGFPQQFSFEKEVLEKSKALYGFISDTYFIDIGVPDDYARVQTELGS